MSSIYKTWAPVYRKLGLEPRPVPPGTKECKIKGWTKTDRELGLPVVESWDRKYADYGIGLRMGTPLPGGGVLGAIDIDNNAYVKPVDAALGGIQCGRFGSKGAVIFVRVMGHPKNSKFRVKGAHAEPYGQVVELLFNKLLCVIPPTIHPNTNEAYKWIGTPLHELDFKNLPIIGEK